MADWLVSPLPSDEGPHGNSIYVGDKFTPHSMHVVSDGVRVASIPVQQPDSQDPLDSGQPCNKLGQGPLEPPGGAVRTVRGG